MLQRQYQMVGAQGGQQDLVAHLEVPQAEAALADILFLSPQASPLEGLGLLRKVACAVDGLQGACRRVACVVVELQGTCVLEDHPNQVAVEVLQKVLEGHP